MRCLMILVTLLVACIRQSHAHTIDVLAGQKECFFEDLSTEDVGILARRRTTHLADCYGRRK